MYDADSQNQNPHLSLQLKEIVWILIFRLTFIRAVSRNTIEVLLSWITEKSKKKLLATHSPFTYSKSTMKTIKQC